MTGYATVMTTIDDGARAQELARALVEERLAACVQILPVESVYRWQGAVEAAREVLLIGKIRAEDFEKVSEAIRRRHSYDVPEIVCLPISDGSPSYIAWLRDATERQD